MSLTSGQVAFRSFYMKLKARNPTLAVLVSEDILNIALFATDSGKDAIQENVDHLREMTSTLPEELILLREDGLQGLGYS